MSHLFPVGTAASLGVLQVGSHIAVDADGVIGLAQSISTTAAPTFAAVISTGAVTDSGNRVVTSVTGTAGAGISIASSITDGPAVAFTVNNTGVLSITSGSGLSVNSAAAGAVSIVNTGVTSILAGSGIVVNNATGAVTISRSGANVVTTRTVAINTAVTAADAYLGATANNVIFTLPLASTLPAAGAGQSFVFKNEGGNSGIKVAATAPNTIDGSADKSLGNNASISVVFSNGQWRII